MSDNSDAIDCGLAMAELYLQWVAKTDPAFECHVFARREAGEVRLYFEGGEVFRIAAWDHLDDATANAVLQQWIGRQVAALDIGARPVDG
jgi:hypothetical protein